MNKRVYLDAAAGRGNPSSIHAEGVLAAAKLAEARRKVAGVLACQPDEIIFTSGGTESNNLAVFGVGKGHRVFSSIEHSSILQTDLRATFVPVDADGLVNLKDLKKALRPETVLVSIAYANNEIGTIQPIREIAKIIRHYRKANSSKLTANSFPLFHTDACQAPRYLDLNVARLGVDLMSLNGAKVGGPKGVGCLYVRRGIKLQPMLVGGGQERGLRAGTENVEGIIRFAKALEAAAKNREKESKRLSALR
ncbi:MAG: aminotransferase class V-fold PLP-dependent enzyme, partial [Candidatus Vogelbacteria bacterium]|nr:aminotransferase class V-fold PLP-dependent enzyme [Candidatus Vogelbacteria bacterium]